MKILKTLPKTLELQTILGSFVLETLPFHYCFSSHFLLVFLLQRTVDTPAKSVRQRKG
jgi:hypothetical protein